jgi:hypothetical protein
LPAPPAEEIEEVDAAQGAQLWTKQLKPASLLVGMDSMGSGKAFSKKEIALAVRVGAAMAEGAQHVESLLWNEHVEWLRTASKGTRKAFEDGLAEEARLVLEAAQETEEDHPTAVVEANAKLRSWTTAYIECREDEQVFLGHVLPPKDDVVAIFATALELVRAPADATYDVCGMPSWERLRTAFPASFRGRMEHFNLLEAERVAPRQTAGALVQALEHAGAVDAVSYLEDTPVVAVLLRWVQCALIVRQVATAAGDEQAEA